MFKLLCGSHGAKLWTETTVIFKCEHFIIPVITPFPSFPIGLSCGGRSCDSLGYLRMYVVLLCYYLKRCTRYLG